MTEKELILAAQKGSQIAYEELIHLHQKTIYYLVFFLCGNEDEAYTIARGVFTTAWQQISYLERINRSFIALLCSLASVDCEQYVKRQKRRITGVIRMSGDTAASPKIEMFLERLSASPFHKRRILLMADMCGLSSVEIADILSSSPEDISTELGAARSASPVSFHEIMPLLPEPPKSFSHEVSDMIQHSSGKSKASSGSKEYKPGRRFAFGRFTIIAACIALLLLAYSGGLLGNGGPALTPPSGGQSQQQPDENPSGSDSGDNDTSNNEENTPGDSGEVLVPGDGASGQPGDAGTQNPSFVPAGEKYTAVYTASTSSASILSQYCSGSFRASLPDGTVAVYYMIPVSNLDTAIAALEGDGLTYAVYDAGSSIDDGAGSALFILYD